MILDDTKLNCQIWLRYFLTYKKIYLQSTYIKSLLICLFYVQYLQRKQQALLHTQSIFIFIFWSQLRRSDAYRKIWHLFKVHNTLIQLLNNSEKEKTVCRPAGGRIGWVKLRRQNELSHREKRSVPHVDRHFHLERSGRLEDHADGFLAIVLVPAHARAYISSKNPIDRSW